MVEEDMEVEVFEVAEIDLDYEYEASRFFDFTREETQAEVREAELWFHSANSYPPSPFVAKLISPDDGFLQHMHVSPKSKGVGVPDEIDKGFAGTSQVILKSMQCGNMFNNQNDAPSLYAGSIRGVKFYDHISQGTKDLKTKLSNKPLLQRGSTLMKPTASYLAKQNQKSLIIGSRFEKPLTSIKAPCITEVQASKRQKLEGGQMRKVENEMQPSYLAHKFPRKDGVVSGTSRLRITNPVEPDLVTRHRAQRLKHTSAEEVDSVASRTNRFRARPLNRKILKVPTVLPLKKSKPQLPEFEVFRLKTMERAMQHTSAVNSNSLSQPTKGPGKDGVCLNNGDHASSRSVAVDERSEDGHQCGPNFGARPLYKKILTSKGDIGVSRNVKRAVTVPKEFDLQTEKRATLYPLTELLGNLSLASELRSEVSGPSKLTQSSIVPSKGSKENLRGCILQEANLNR